MRLTTDLKKILNGDLPLDFNWNCDQHPDSPIPKKIPPEPGVNSLKKVIIDDEGLRDGLHGVSEYPSIEDMMRYVKASHELGIKVMTVGIYSGNGVVDTTTKKLLKEMNKTFPDISPIVLSLTSKESLQWAAECQSLNPKLQTLVFMGTAPSRMIVEGWSKEQVIKQLGWAIKTAVSKYKLFVIGGSEHTTQTPPDFLKLIIKTQIKNGAKIFCIADTIGSLRPIGVYRIVKYVKKILKELNTDKVLLDWHGHRDIGFTMPNIMAAIEAGVARVHLVPWGIGERAGNASLEKFLVNSYQILKEHKTESPWDLKKLTAVLQIYAEITNNQFPAYGCLSQRSFFTSLGIHTAAIFKAEKLAIEAEKRGHLEIVPRLKEMARRVYCGIDPHLVGREYQIGIGPYSGKSSVKLWAITKGLREPSERSIKRILETAKSLRRSLTEQEIYRLINKK